MMFHARPSDFDRMRSGQATPDETLTLIRHLHDCSECEGNWSDVPKDPGPALAWAILGSEVVTSHLDPESELFPYVDRTIDRAQREVVESHLELCDECRREVEELSVIRSRIQVDADGVADEAAAADLLARGVLDSTTDAIDETFPTIAMASPAVAWKLLDALNRNTYQWEPGRILAVAKLAFRIAAALPNRLPDLEFVALKEQSTALRLLFRFADAHRCLDAAAMVALKTSAAHVNLAIIDYARAGVCCEAQQRQDALVFLHRAQPIFRSSGETRRLEQSQTLEAAILFGMARYREACTIFKAALAAALDRNDSQRVAMEAFNVGCCCMELEETEAARGHFSSAVELAAAEGMKWQQARALRALGRLTIRESGADEKGELLDAARIFGELGLIGQWCLTRLALAEELLELAPDADVTLICEEVLNRAVTAGISTIAANALALLSLAAQRREASPDFVREVSQYIDPEQVAAIAPAKSKEN
ncbi:MAG TPA: zf-HC2 domain-containing protein [Thermoanaerobaculia bacterium]|nr:zf-HC2 domain-containing protein [Thermoanaerobaculia bacterium]